MVPVLDADAPDVTDLYEDISLHQVHEYIIQENLSVEQGDVLLNLWTKVNLANCGAKLIVFTINVFDTEWRVQRC